MARQVADSGLPSDSDTLGDVARRASAAQIPCVGPSGGWMRAAEHAQETINKTMPYFKTYIGSHDVLPGCHVDPMIAAMMTMAARY